MVCGQTCLVDTGAKLWVLSDTILNAMIKNPVMYYTDITLVSPSGTDIAAIGKTWVALSI